MSFVITTGVLYVKSAIVAGTERDTTSKAPICHGQSPFALAMFSKRYWFQGLLFSSQMTLFSPAIDHVMPVTFLIVVHASRFVLRAFSVKRPGYLSA